MENKETPASEGYTKALDDLLKQGYSKRQATRYLDSIAKRNYKKFMKKRNKH